LTIPGQTFTTSSPVVGANGNVYVLSFDIPERFVLGQHTPGESMPGWLSAYSPDGALLWRSSLASSSSLTPVIDQRNGKERIYVISDRSLLSVFSGQGAPIWSLLLRGTAGEGPVDAPLIAEDLGGGRTIYQGIGNGLIYAIRDHETHGEMMWAKAPGAKISRGMLLKDGVLYAPTLDGGEGQWVQIKAVKVHSLNLASSAPWPMTGGNLGGSGISHLSLKQN